MTEDEMDKLAAKIANAKGPLAGVTPANAQERMTNLIRHDPEWARRVHAGEVTATAEFDQLTRMTVEHQQATTAASVQAEKERWDAEQRQREAGAQ